MTDIIFRVIKISALLGGILLTVNCGNSSPGAMTSSRGLPATSATTHEVAAAASETDEAPATTAVQPSSTSERAATREAAPARTRVATPRSIALSESELSVRRLVVSTGIENREPVGAASRFELGNGRLFAFVEAVNDGEEEGELIVTFEADDGTEVGFITLDVPANAPRWRTWAWSQNITSAGSWTAVIRTADGDVLARERFEIEG